MPAQYEAIRDKLESEGKSAKSATKHAAMIYNSKHPKDPVGPHSDSKKRGKKNPFRGIADHAGNLFKHGKV